MLQVLADLSKRIYARSTNLLDDHKDSHGQRRQHAKLKRNMKTNFLIPPSSAKRLFNPDPSNSSIRNQSSHISATTRTLLMVPQGWLWHGRVVKCIIQLSAQRKLIEHLTQSNYPMSNSSIRNWPKTC